MSVIGLVAGNRQGRGLAWQFVKDNWAELDRRYGEGGFALMRLVNITSGFTSLEMREDVERFFADNPAKGAERITSPVSQRYGGKRRSAASGSRRAVTPACLSQ